MKITTSNDNGTDNDRDGKMNKHARRSHGNNEKVVAVRVVTAVRVVLQVLCLLRREMITHNRCGIYALQALGRMGFHIDACRRSCLFYSIPQSGTR